MSTTPRVPTEGKGSGMFAGNPELGRAFGQLYGVFWREGALDSRVKETVRIRNARVTDCGY